MHNIKSISTISLIQQANSNNESIAQQLEDLINQFRDHMDDKDPTQEVKIMQQIEDLLTKNSGLILEQCFMNGYRQNSKDWTEHYATFLSQGIALIQNTIEYHEQHPTSPLPSLDLINEMITQLHFLMATQAP